MTASTKRTKVKQMRKPIGHVRIKKLAEERVAAREVAKQREAAVKRAEERERALKERHEAERKAEDEYMLRDGHRSSLFYKGWAEGRGRPLLEAQAAEVAERAAEIAEREARAIALRTGAAPAKIAVPISPSAKKKLLGGVQRKVAVSFSGKSKKLARKLGARTRAKRDGDE
jgi:hypothetical protein